MDPTAGSENNLRTIIHDQLVKIGTSGPWLWKIFFLCVSPNILNGFHVSSYVFLGHMPDSYYCVIPDLIVNTKWNHDQMRNISTTAGTTEKYNCGILNWNYTALGQMSYQDALQFTQNQPNPGEISCKSNGINYYHYEQEPETSIVTEWDLVCENNVWRTTVQVGVSIGKFLAASTFGILSDKYGRKRAFTVASAIYMVSGIATTFSPWYILFLLGRIGLGMSGSGLFYPSFTLLTENIALKHRSWMSVVFTISYPVGTLLLALSAYFIHPWRYLQMSLILPGVLLIFHCYFLDESPRWLLSKNRDKDAYKIVFGKEPTPELMLKAKKDDEVVVVDEKVTTFGTKLKKSVAEFSALFSCPTLRRRILICYFTWFVVSMSYYVTAINGDNLSANRYLYVTFTGLVDIPSYFVPIIILRYVGRRMSTFSLFALAGASLLIVLAIPQGHSNWVVFFAMFGRFGISAVYAVVTLHTAELFPTEIRNSALGTSSTMAHIGSMIAPYIVDLLGILAWFIPTTICGIAIVAAALLSLLQPETKNKDLHDHVKEEEIDDSSNEKQIT